MKLRESDFMKIEVRKACRTDLYSVLDLAFEKKPVFDLALCDRFDEVLAQTGHSVLLCFSDGALCGLMSVVIVDGITDKFPVALFCGGKVKTAATVMRLQTHSFKRARKFQKAMAAKECIIDTRCPNSNITEFCV